MLQENAKHKDYLTSLASSSSEVSGPFMSYRFFCRESKKINLHECRQRDDVRAHNMHVVYVMNVVFKLSSPRKDTRIRMAGAKSVA